VGHLCSVSIFEKGDMNWKLLSIMMLLAFPSAFLGSTLLTYVSNDFMKPYYWLFFLFSDLYTPRKFLVNTLKKIIQELKFGMLLQSVLLLVCMMGLLVQERKFLWLLHSHYGIRFFMLPQMQNGKLID
jgi:uncharacterized membrane protein YfcA